ncbi:Siderophore synthetase component [Marinobacter gudaonensis]|uniref:Siderophore synthetase component n=1 Tax=Marinobacter gudaonensis TaxID=375760 RepID=A0A1I6H3Q5_9GAMM|nr:IucA/IucC family protein [Marinobacter gudaonensis]SFR49073.1 Siderophore synthetase component [Marinobacter gudaonensis]
MTRNTALSSTDPGQYLTRRLVDALIREDVAGCQSDSQAVGVDGVPGSPGTPATWLRWTLAQGILWLPVHPATFMQRWQWSGDALIWQPAGQVGSVSEVNHYEQVLACLTAEEHDDSGEQLEIYADECRTAEAHDTLCLAERSRWFDDIRHQGQSWKDFPRLSERMLHFDRLAAFLDHPFYPSARAKSGFDKAALVAYAPEFAPRFQLRWLAVPGSEVTSMGELPGCWPDFSEVGLDNRLADSYQLLPVHPHLWDTALSEYLSTTDIGARVIRAPAPALWVQPTLSVRTLQLEAAPEVHVKVPLTIRTLGNRNIRTVKPSTLYDGHTVQKILQEIAGKDPVLKGTFSVTDESSGLHVGDLPWLGCIVRRFCGFSDQQQIVPVASLLADSPDGRCVAQMMADEFNRGDLTEWVRQYVALTLTVHLRLWLVYGIALESNQQNSMVLLTPGRPPQLLFKDNDAPRLRPDRLRGQMPSIESKVAQLRDQRILVKDETPLAQMFTTITLQLNLAVILEGLSARGLGSRAHWYRVLREEVISVLDQLDDLGVNTQPARKVLLEDRQLYTKYLLRAGSLESKSRTGAADINKFYGKLAPNFLRNGS